MRDVEVGDRRRSARACTRGRVVTRGSQCGRGELIDVSATGVRFRLDQGGADHQVDDQVDVELRFDGATGGWWGMRGRVARIDRGAEVVVVFDGIPAKLEGDIDAQRFAADGDAEVMHVLLVDPDPRRRAEVAATLRAAGRRVSEAATPLDAVDRLGESRDHPRMIAIADTVPTSVADGLRAHVRLEHASLLLVRLRSDES